jgi:hypothetical protein
LPSEALRSHLEDQQLLLTHAWPEIAAACSNDQNAVPQREVRRLQAARHAG